MFSLHFLDLPPWLQDLQSQALLVLGALLVHLVATRLLVRAANAVFTRTSTSWDDLLVEFRVVHRAAHVAPGVFLYLAAPALLSEEPAAWVQRLTLAYLSIAGTLAVIALINAAHAGYTRLPASRSRNLRGVQQTLQILIGACGFIFALAALMDASPWKFISGLGALSAVLLLVFKDSILGLVASLQVSANDSVRVGDWIEMPKYGADGDVIDITLASVKVQNWDKTISTIPTYALIADPVKNWRGMSESGGRRIKRSVDIDMHTVRFCDEEMLSRFRKFEAVSDYLEERIQDVSRYNQESGSDTSVPLNGRRLTNLGCFRAYLLGYLQRHPLISKDMTLLVRQLAPTDKGLPIEIYVFCTDTRWVQYEDIQADLFDHILAALPEFDLAVFQTPSGRLADLAESLKESQ